MNLIGGDINDNLSLRLSPFLEYTKRETKLRENATAGETDSFVSLGTYSIYPIGGAEFIIKHIDDLNNFGDAIFTEKINPRMYLTSTNPKVVTWIEQGYLKAKYIGTNVPQYDDGVIDLTMEKTFGGGVNYSILNIADFVSKTIANSHGKNISGVR